MKRSEEVEEWRLSSLEKTSLPANLRLFFFFFFLSEVDEEDLSEDDLSIVVVEDDLSVEDDFSPFSLLSDLSLSPLSLLSVLSPLSVLSEDDFLGLLGELVLVNALSLCDTSTKVPSTVIRGTLRVFLPLVLVLVDEPVVVVDREGEEAEGGMTSSSSEMELMTSAADWAKEEPMEVDGTER